MSASVGCWPSLLVLIVGFWFGVWAAEGWVERSTSSGSLLEEGEVGARGGGSGRATLSVVHGRTSRRIGLLETHAWKVLSAGYLGDLFQA